MKTTAECKFNQTAYVHKLTRHTHRWGQDFDVWFAGGEKDGEHIFKSEHYEDVDHVFSEPILVEKGEMPRALELLRKANTLAPEMGDIQYHMAVALHKSGRSNEARRELERLLKSERRFSMQSEAHNLLRQLGGG